MGSTRTPKAHGDRDLLLLVVVAPHRGHRDRDCYSLSEKSMCDRGNVPGFIQVITVPSYLMALLLTRIFLGHPKTPQYSLKGHLKVRIKIAILGPNAHTQIWSFPQSE